MVFHSGAAITIAIPTLWIDTVNILMSVEADTESLPSPRSSVKLSHKTWGGVISFHWVFITNKATFSELSPIASDHRRI